MIKKIVTLCLCGACALGAEPGHTRRCQEPGGPGAAVAWAERPGRGQDPCACGDALLKHRGLPAHLGPDSAPWHPEGGDRPMVSGRAQPGAAGSACVWTLARPCPCS